MNAGRLEIELMADVARLSKDMAAAKSMVGNAMTEISRMANIATAALGAIGVGASVAGLAALGKATVDAMAKMKDLGIESGTTAAAISRFEEPARKAGSSVDAVASSIFKVSKALLDARDPMSGAGQALRSIGLSAEQLKGLKPDEAFEKIARSLSQYSDGVQKNAVMQELFGKSGREMSRVIAEIADKAELLATVTDKDAEAADRFGDQMVELKMLSEQTWRSMVAEGLPALNKLLAAFIEGKKEAGLYAGAIRALSEAFGGGVEDRIAGINKEIADLQKLIQQGPGLLEKVLGVDQTQKLQARIDALRAIRDGLQSVVHAGEMAEQNRRALEGKRKGDPAFDPNAAKEAARAFREEWDAAFADMKAELVDLEKKWAAMEKLVKRLDDEIDDGLVKSLKDIGDDVAAAADKGMQPWLELGAVWDDMANRGASFFQDLLFSGAKAMDVLKAHLRSFLADLVAIFAKRWILQLGASMPGLGFLGDAAASTGAGTGPGSLLTSGLSLGSTFGSILPSGAIGSAFASGATGLATSMGVSNIGYLSMISTAASWLPVIGAGIAVVSMLYSMFNDGPENPNLRIFQGSGGQGGFGGVRTEGNYGWDGTQLMAYIGSLDARFARVLGPSGSASATSALSAYSQAGLRMDGQPAQMAFPEGDANAAEAIAMELLRSRYGILFEQIDKELAEQVRSFGGNSQELQAFIESMLGLLEGLGSVNLRGLNLETLRAFQRDGEELTATFQRVAGGWAQMNAIFAEDNSVELLADIFSDFGQSMPTTVEGWKALIQSLDASDPAMRAFIDALTAVPGAVESVVSATRAAMNDFDSLMSRIRPGYAAGMASGDISAFRDRNSWIFGGESDEGIIAALRTITREDFSRYDATSQRLILAILNNSTSTDRNTAATQDFTNAALGPASILDEQIRAWKEMNAAQGTLKQWWNGAFLNTSITTLGPQERLAEAKRQYEAQLALAQGGNAGAIAGLGGFAQTYLEIARQIFQGSGAYNDIFRTVMGQTGGAAGISQADVNARLAGALPATGQLLSGEVFIAKLDELIGAVVDSLRTSDDRAQASAEEVVSTIRVGAQRGVLMRA